MKQLQSYFYKLIIHLTLFFYSFLTLNYIALCFSDWLFQMILYLNKRSPTSQSYLICSLFSPSNMRLFSSYLLWLRWHRDVLNSFIFNLFCSTDIMLTICSQVWFICCFWSWSLWERSEACLWILFWCIEWKSKWKLTLRLDYTSSSRKFLRMASLPLFLHRMSKSIVKLILKLQKYC
jgi:hypothetical protein